MDGFVLPISNKYFVGIYSARVRSHIKKCYRKNSGVNVKPQLPVAEKNFYFHI